MGEAKNDSKREDVEVLGIRFSEGWDEGDQKRFSRVFKPDLADIEGRGRLGELAFDEAPEEIAAIRGILSDLAEEPKRGLPDKLTNELPGKLDGLIRLLESMQKLSPREFEPETPNQQTRRKPLDFRSERDRLANLLTENRNWFRNEVGPFTLNARVRRSVNEILSEAGAPDIVDMTETARAKLREVDAEIDSRKDLVEALRQTAGEGAGRDLAQFFKDRANNLRGDANFWVFNLLGSIGLTVGVAIAAFLVLRPNPEATDPASLAQLGLGVFLVGLFAFLIRICAQQFRVKKHLEAVSEAKAAALSTFSQITAVHEDANVRAAVATALAQAVFTTENTGLTDGSSDQVTIIERAIPSTVFRTTDGSQ